MNALQGIGLSLNWNEHAWQLTKVGTGVISAPLIGYVGAAVGSVLALLAEDAARSERIRLPAESKISLTQIGLVAAPGYVAALLDAVGSAPHFSLGVKTGGIAFSTILGLLSGVGNREDWSLSLPMGLLASALAFVTAGIVPKYPFLLSGSHVAATTAFLVSRMTRLPVVGIPQVTVLNNTHQIVPPIVHKSCSSSRCTQSPSRYQQ